VTIRQSYDDWADQYDRDENRTRDLESYAQREALGHYRVENCLEIGCGTGKNTQWLSSRASDLTAIDFSSNMLERAKMKTGTDRVQFIQADINGEWSFAEGTYGLVSFSLVLEHIENLDVVFRKVASVTGKDSLVYVGELHPFKQYAGSKARFLAASGPAAVPCFVHNLSDFTEAADKNGFELIRVMEHFDDGDKSTLPRILTLLFRKVA
jgi:ubiquinone/menaquinone biosynthesis C-methylase UbiE